MDNRVLTLRETKDGTTARVPFNDEVWLTFTTLDRVDGNTHVFPGRGPSGRLDNVKKSFNAALTLAKIENFRFHDLRHTFASHLVPSCEVDPISLDTYEWRIPCPRRSAR